MAKSLSKASLGEFLAFAVPQASQGGRGGDRRPSTYHEAKRGVKANCYCFGYGEVDDAKVDELKTFIEFASGRQPKGIKLREYALRLDHGRTPNTLWAEQSLPQPSASGKAATGAAGGGGYKLCCSGRMRSAVQVRGGVGQMKSLVEVALSGCDSRAAFLAQLAKLNLSVQHDYIKEGCVFHLEDKGQESLLLDESENKFRLDARIVRLKMCEELEGVMEEEVAFPGKWLVELVAKAQGADYAEAVASFEDFAKKLGPIVKIQAVA